MAIPHVRLNDGAKRPDVIGAIKKQLAESYGIDHANVETGYCADAGRGR
ncbi:MAG: hypothetical protein ACRECW_12745 [Phyllobacterium sp.]